MSTCPEFELYSVYLDQEMPDTHQKAFSEHLQSCPDCQQRFSRLKEMQSALHMDSHMITLSQNDTEDSFKKLCMIMNYKAVTKKANSPIFPKTLKIVSPALAAVMIFAFILPIRMLQNKDTVHNIMAPQNKVSASLINHRGIIVDNSLSSVLSNSHTLQKLTSIDFSNTSISSIDIFKPVLATDSITIQIKLTGFNDIQPYTTSALQEASFTGSAGAQF